MRCDSIWENARLATMQRAPEELRIVEDGFVASAAETYVLKGRFKGGWTTRHYGQPRKGIHAIQMELAMRGYLREPDEPTSSNWPAPFDPILAAPLQSSLRAILQTCLAFAKGQK